MMLSSPCVCLLLTLVTRPGIVFPSVDQRFVSEQISCSDGPLIAYRLHVPEMRSGPQPLLIWFHGVGEAGTNNRDQLSWLELVFGDGATNMEVPCYVLAIQAPTRAGWSVDSDSDPLARVAAVHEHICGTRPIDGDRIYLAGISQGAVAACQYARRSRAPVAGMLLLGMNSQVRVSSPLEQVAVWAFQSAADGQKHVNDMFKFVWHLRQRGAQAQATVVASPNHDCWTAAFRHHRVFKWLMQQHRRDVETQEVQEVRLAWVTAALCLIVICVFAALIADDTTTSWNERESQ